MLQRDQQRRQLAEQEAVRQQIMALQSRLATVEALDRGGDSLGRKVSHLQRDFKTINMKVHEKEVSDLKSHLKQLESEKRELAKQLENQENHAHHGHGHEEEEECECPFGQHQSPINIMSDVDGVQTIQMGAGQQKKTLEFAYPHSFTNCSILNNGYTVQINIGDQDSNPGTVEVAGKVYTLRQFHFHTPSEHMLNDKQYEMEMHLVHTTDAGDIAVLGFIFSVDQRFQKTTGDLTQHRRGVHVQDEEDEYDESTILKKMSPSNDFLNQFWAQLPMKKCDDIPLDNDLTFDHLFEASSSTIKKTSRRGQVLVKMDIFRYDGSLTTPPYSEGVQWMVAKSLHFISPKQVKELSACWGHKNNARDCQDYFDRKVKIRSNMTMQLVE